jgi:hypothetical protein
MTNFILGALAAAALTVAAAGVSQAETVSVEAKSVSPDHGANYGTLTLGATAASYYGTTAVGSLEVRQAAHNGTVVGAAAVGVTKTVPVTLYGTALKATGGVEFGDFIQPKNDVMFYGLTAGVSTPVTLPATVGLAKPVTISVGYRVREGLGDEHFSEQRRVSVGASYPVTDNLTLGVTYYREHAAFLTSASANNKNVVGVSLTRKF